MFQRPDRRTLLRLAALAPAFALPGLARADVGAPKAAQAGGYYRFSIGSMTATVISDGHLTLPTSVLGVNAPREEVVAFLHAHYESTETTVAQANMLVVEQGTNKVLIDVGSGTFFQPTAGKLAANLTAAGIEPGSITHIINTHAHPDHIWGIRDAEGKPLFGQAPITLAQTEHAFWTADGLADRMPEGMRDMTKMTATTLAAVKDRLNLVADGTEVLPGIRLIATPGHTPGHMSVHLADGDHALIFTGDVITHPYISFEQPGWVFGFDADGGQATETRKKLLDMAATDRIALLGYHFPFPGIGHALKDGDAYRYLPALWQWG